MNNNDNFKIDFEEKFRNNEDENEKLKYVPNKDNSVFTLIVYLVLFFLGGASLLVTFLFKPPSNDFLVLESFELYENDNIVAFMLKESYSIEKDNFNLDEFVFEFDNETYVLISFNENKDFINSNYEEIVNGTIDEWDEDNELFIIVGTNSKGSELVKYHDNSILINSGYSIYQNGIIMFLSYVIVSIPLIIINRKKLLVDINDFLVNEKKPALGNLASSFATMFAVSIGLGILSNILIQAFGFKTDSVNQESIILMLRSKSFILIAITTVLIGPLVEELVFRKAIFGLLKKDNVAITISAISFGLIHIVSELLDLIGSINFFSVFEVLVTSIPYIGMGVAFSILYVKNNKNVFLLYLVHALLNLLSIITIFLS